MLTEPSSGFINFRKYTVIEEPAEPGLPAIVMVFEEQVTSSEQTNFSKAVQSERGISDFFDSVSGVPSNLAGSVRDLVGSSSTQNSVADNYINNQSLQQLIGNYTSAMMAIAGKVVAINFVIELSFSDGSTGYFKLTGIDGSGVLQLTFHKGVDSNGNTVLPNKASYGTGTYSFAGTSGSGLSSFVEAVRRLGIPVTSVSGGANSVEVECKVTTKGMECYIKNTN